MKNYSYQIRSYAAPLSDGEYEIISTHNSLVAADRQFRRRYGGRTGAINHGIVVIEGDHAYSLEEAPADAFAEYASPYRKARW